MSDTTQHGESRLLAQSKPLLHPGEEVRQTVMSSLDTLGDTGTARGEREGCRRIRSKHNSSRGRFVLLEWCEDILFSRSRTSHTRLAKRDSGDKKPE